MQPELNQIDKLTKNDILAIPTGTPVCYKSNGTETTDGVIFQGFDSDHDPFTFVLHNVTSTSYMSDIKEDGDFGRLPDYLEHYIGANRLCCYSDEQTEWADENGVEIFYIKPKVAQPAKMAITIKLKTEKPRKATVDAYVKEAKAKGVTNLTFEMPSGKTVEVDLTEDTKPKYFNNQILSTFQEDDIKAVELAMDMNLPTLLIGHTGLGKTTLVKALSEAHGKDLIRFSVHSQTSSDEIIGKWLAKGGETVWQDGVLVTAMKKGDHFVMDEINMCPADVLSQLHALLDDDRHIIMSEKDGSILRPHADFRFFGTMNPQDEYAGTKELNMAFLSRFTSVVTIEPFDSATETAILERKGLSTATATDLVSIANNLREMHTKEDITFFCGTRDIINTGLLIEKGLDRNVAIKVGLLNKMSKDDAQHVIKTLGVNIAPKKSAQEIKIVELGNFITKLSQEVADKQKDLTDAQKIILTQDQEIKDLKNQQGTVGGIAIDETTKAALKILGKLK